MVALETISTGLQIVGTVRDLARSAKKSDNVINRKVCKQLRTIYFTPNGVLRLMKAIEQGTTLGGTEVERVLTEFNDGEWQVRQAAEELAHENLENELGLTIKDVREIDKIRWKKISVRAEIQKAINHYRQPRRKVDQGKIAELIKEVEALNSAIEELEARVNERARA